MIREHYITAIHNIEQKGWMLKKQIDNTL